MFIPIPTDDEDETALPPPTENGHNLYRAAYIDWYLNVPPWKCDACGAMMFGRMEYCAYCKFRLNKHTPRPEL